MKKALENIIKTGKNGTNGPKINHLVAQHVFLLSSYYFQYVFKLDHPEILGRVMKKRWCLGV